MQEANNRVWRNFYRGKLFSIDPGATLAIAENLTNQQKLWV